jgi:(p)ppGpp synthase/HD superfamily hydrolase
VDGTFTCEIGIQMNNKVRLEEIIKKLQKLKEVDTVTRAAVD